MAAMRKMTAPNTLMELVDKLAEANEANKSNKADNGPSPAYVGWHVV